MAGAGLLEIKRRIRSIKNTQKITRAMGLVATVKVRRMKERAEAVTPFYETFSESVKSLAASGEAADSIYINNTKSDTDLYIVITSDSGLCGSYNVNVINTALNHMYGKKVLLITVGERGKSFFTRNGYETLAEFVEIGDEPGLSEAREIITIALREYNSGRVGNIYLAYTRYHSAVKQEAEVIRLLPLDAVSDRKKAGVLLEPSGKAVVEGVVSSYLSTSLLYALANSIASEYSIRMSAMDGATKNAAEILYKLNLAYNRARQSSITQEITEIVSGAEALKD